MCARLAGADEGTANEFFCCWLPTWQAHYIVTLRRDVGVVSCGFGERPEDPAAEPMDSMMEECQARLSLYLANAA